MWTHGEDAGVNMLVFGHYHAAMPMPELGEQGGAADEKKAKVEPNRLIFQAVDSVLLIARAIEQAKSTDSAAIIKALQTMKFDGVRGSFSFSQEPGCKYHHWVDIPYVPNHLPDLNQPVISTPLIQVQVEPRHVARSVPPN